MSEYDNVDRRILYSKEKCSGGGIEVVPMTVLEYGYNSKWIIAKSAPSKNRTDYQYWIIDKDFDIHDANENQHRIKTCVQGPLDSASFTIKLRDNNIELTLKKI